MFFFAADMPRPLHELPAAIAVVFVLWASHDAASAATAAVVLAPEQWLELPATAVFALVLLAAQEELEEAAYTAAEVLLAHPFALALAAAAVRELVLLSSHAEECVAHVPAATKASAGRASRKSLIAHLQKVVWAPRTDALASTR
jgi:hypothetical protein